MWISSASTIRQFRDRVQFRWWSGGNPHNSDRMYFFISIDKDRNPETGRNFGGIGAETTIGVNVDTYVARFDEAGGWLGNQPGPRVIFMDDGFVFDVDRSWLDSEQFSVYFEASGQPTWSDSGPVQDIVLEDTRPGPTVILTAERYAIEGHLKVVDIPDQQTSLQLQAHLAQGNTVTELDHSQVDYFVFHNSPVIFDAESIISIDDTGIAHSNSVGFVFASAEVSSCGLNSDVIILATGEVHQITGESQVVAIWRADYSPNLVNATYGEIMAAYPDFLHTMNVAYRILSDLYTGFRPFDGDTQILTRPSRLTATVTPGTRCFPPLTVFSITMALQATSRSSTKWGTIWQQSRGMSLLTRPQGSRVPSPWVLGNAPPRYRSFTCFPWKSSEYGGATVVWPGHLRRGRIQQLVAATGRFDISTITRRFRGSDPERRDQRSI